jgi:hypothetical protein
MPIPRNGNSTPHPKIPLYLECNSQKENALASFCVQRAGKKRPSQVMVKGDFAWMISNI